MKCSIFFHVSLGLDLPGNSSMSLLTRFLFSSSHIWENMRKEKSCEKERKLLSYMYNHSKNNCRQPMNSYTSSTVALDLSSFFFLCLVQVFNRSKKFSMSRFKLATALYKTSKSLGLDSTQMMRSKSICSIILS